MPEIQRMHFVPRTYLKRFSVEKIKAGTKEFYINALDKANILGKIESRNIKRICKEDNLYTMPGETEEERMSIENIYKHLYENGYDALYTLMIDGAREHITYEERYAIVGFIVSLFFRNNSWNNFFNKTLSEAYEKAYTLSKSNGKSSFYFEDMEVSIIGKTLDELMVENKKQDAPMIAMTMLQKILELVRLRVNNDFISIIKTKNEFEFITSDNPVFFKAKNTNFRPIPFDPNNSLWLPLDKNHLLQVEPWANELDWKMIGRNNDIIGFPGLIASMSNHFQFIQASKYILGTETGLTAFQKKPQGILTNRIKQGREF
jgi:hypothetical protein